jgi:hypothetical protein
MNMAEPKVIARGRHGGLGEPEVALEEPDDFTRFHVAARGARDRSRLGDAFTGAGAGALDGDDVLVDVAWLRAAATAGGVGPDWDQGFTAMLDYAERKGWTDAGRRAVRAHVEWGQ